MGVHMHSSVRWFFATILISFLALPSQVFSQQPQGAQKMNAMVGEWKYDNLDGEVSCEWFGELIVRCTSSWTTDDGESRKLVFFTKYDPESEVYETYRFNSNGYTDSGYGWVDGNTWTLVFEGTKGARYKITSTISEDTWSYKWHISQKGGPWKPGNEGSARKVM